MARHRPGTMIFLRFFLRNILSCLASVLIMLAIRIISSNDNLTWLALFTASGCLVIAFDLLKVWINDK